MPQTDFMHVATISCPTYRLEKESIMSTVVVMAIFNQDLKNIENVL